MQQDLIDALDGKKKTTEPAPTRAETRARSYGVRHTRTRNAKNAIKQKSNEPMSWQQKVLTAKEHARQYLGTLKQIQGIQGESHLIDPHARFLSGIPFSMLEAFDKEDKERFVRHPFGPYSVRTFTDPRAMASKVCSLRDANCEHNRASPWVYIHTLTPISVLALAMHCMMRRCLQIHQQKYREKRDGKVEALRQAKRSEGKLDRLRSGTSLSEKRPTIRMTKASRARGLGVWELGYVPMHQTLQQRRLGMDVRGEGMNVRG
eukprot:2301953-Pyramimonas_sp.AAC.1